MRMRCGARLGQPRSTIPLCRSAGLIGFAQTRMMAALNKPFRLPAILSIIAATFAVYWPSLRNQFVWDDTALILRDPFIRSWRLIPWGIGHFLFTDATPSNFYRPIQRLTYTFDYALYAFDPWGYHLTSILLHAAAAVALFFFVQKLIERAGGVGSPKGGVLAWLAALAWAVHPVHSAAVSYIAGRADVLAALFGFCGLYSGLCSLEKKSRLLAWLAAFCFLAAFLSKESGGTALLIWLAVLVCLREFAALRGWLVIALAVVTVYCGLRFTAESTPPPVFGAPPFVAERPVLVARAFDVYAGLLAAPVNLHMERDIPKGFHADVWQLVLGVLLMAAFAMWLWWTRRRLFPAFIFLVAFIIAYAPTSNIMPLNAYVAEHWLYFSSAFLFAAAALSLNAAPVSRAFLLTVFACWLAFLAGRNFMRNFDWRNQRAFLESTIANGGDSARMLINLGSLESAEGHQQIAIAHFQNALSERPDQPFALLGLGTAYMRARDFDKARAQLERARIIPFVHAEALRDLAALESQQNRTVNLGLLAKAASLEPDNWDIQSTYIKTLADSGRIPEAIQSLRALLDKQPWRAASWKLMAQLLVRDGRPDLAVFPLGKAHAYDVHLNMTNDQ